MERFLAKAHERFNSCDSNHDGYLVAAETNDCMPRVAGHFDQVDSNGDGRISFDELVAYIRSVRSSR